MANIKKWCGKSKEGYLLIFVNIIVLVCFNSTNCTNRKK